MIRETRTDEPFLRLEGISRSFGAVQALRDINLEVRRAEILGLVGDNGAGKSTLVKIISGAYPSERGKMYINGEPVRLTNPKQARGHGIAIIHQDLAVADILDVTTNVYMGQELRILGIFTDNRRMKANTWKAIHRLRSTVKSLEQPVSALSGGQKRAVAIARYLVESSTNLLLMDEPTAGLGVEQSERVIDLILETRQQGIGVVFVSHNLEHVLKVADRVVVLASGEKCAELSPKNTDVKNLVELMMGAK